MSEFFAPLVPFVVEYGAVGLFIFCALSASILPISSEAALIATMAAGFGPWEALAWASAGNCFGVLVNYWVGHLFEARVRNRLARSKSGQSALDRIDRSGWVALLLSWTPFLGDPITYAAGAVGMPLRRFVPITFSLRIARYFVFVLFFLP